ncbi:transcription factor tfiih complex subunit tfb2 [Moniliophthora roreri]|nr:transcription factor tfiih complex subunit tfb2 [Moniliophthora roreri]
MRQARQDDDTNPDSASNPHSLLPFLQVQSPTSLSRLYQSPSSCLSIFRLLAPVERQIVMNMLWLESAMTPSTLAAWVTAEGQNRLYESSLDTLSRLHILHNYPAKLALNSTFKTSLRHAITGGGTTGSFGVPAEKDEKRAPLDIDGLDSYALERWETILHFMVSSGTGQNPQRPSPGVLYLLQRSGLMGSHHGSVPQITSAGFQFLLHPSHAQLWNLLLQYLHMAEERQMDLVEVLSFLFMLSTMELGREYSTEHLSQTQRAMLEDLRDYGLLWQRRPNSRRFSPTRLATTLTSSSPTLPTNAGTSSGSQQGFIVLETNYRYRFPNLVVGSITRESVKKALSNGISADQLFDNTRSSPNAKKFTVQDQIRLWELEKNRLKSQEGTCSFQLCIEFRSYLYTGFASQADYEFVLSYAKQLDVVLWESSAKRSFFGSTEGHANIRNFIERRAGQGS